jgi:tetratricopeptide (TPR) repeat protein
MSYICKNIDCSAPENKKGKTYPSAMECPFCDAPLVEIVSLDEPDLKLINSLPYVIAYPLKRTISEKHPWTKINLLKDTFLNYLKYLGLLTASEFFNSPFKDKKMVALFQQALAEPSFGSWNQYIRETLFYLKENNHNFFCPDILAYYEIVETGKKRKLFKGEIEYIDSNGDVQLKRQEATAIGMLINFRNRYLGHGLTLDEADSKKLWEEYYPIFRILLEPLTFTKDFPMYKHEHGETYQLQSVDLNPIEKGAQLSARVWMENPEGKSMDILPFFVVPGELSLAKEGKEQILTYESYTGKTIKFFSPEGTEKQTSGKTLEKLNFLLRDKQKEQLYSPEAFTKTVFLTRVSEENKLIRDTLIAEKKVITGVYVHREEMEIKLREWIGARANIFVLAAEAGSGKTNLMLEMQLQYTRLEMPALLVRAGRMEKTTLKAQLCYLLNIDENENLDQYPALAGTQEAPTFILIDGLNEAPQAQALWLELFEISKIFEPGSLKFVVTSRANTAADINRYSINIEQESFLNGNSKTKETQVSAYTHWLAALSMEEMKQAWEYYVQKDKSKFNPLFAFDDLASFDRALYNQISNPLVLRLFLEIYHGKNLSKKGKQYLDIWSDWLSSFSTQEQDFFKSLADAIWEKGENELLLDDVLKDNKLNNYFTNDQLNAPYPRLRNLGWVSRYVKDLNACVGFTVEGALLHLLGNKLESQQPPIGRNEIIKLIQTGSKLQQIGVGAYLQHLALQGDLKLICELIDAGEQFIEACITPIVLHLKTIGVKETLDILLQNITENDWKVLLKVDTTLEELTLHPLRKELALQVLPRNKFSSNAAIRLGLRMIPLFDNNNAEEYISKILSNINQAKNDLEYKYELGKIEFHFGQYDKALNYSYYLLDFLEKNKHVSLTFDLQDILSDIGEILFEKEEYQKSLEFSRKALELRLSLRHNIELKVANSYNNVGCVLLKLNDFEEALKNLKQSINIKKRIVGSKHPDIAVTLHNIAAFLESKEEFTNALENFNSSLEINENIYGEKHPILVKTLIYIGGIYKKMGDHNIALKTFERAATILKTNNLTNHPSMAKVYESLGLYWKGNDNNNALIYFEMALDIYLKNAESMNSNVATCYLNIGQIWADKSDYDKALDFYQNCLNIRLKTFGEHNLNVANTFNAIGTVWSIKDNIQKALENYKKCLNIYLETSNHYHINLATVCQNIGVNAIKIGEYENAHFNLQRCLEIQINSLGQEHPEVAYSINLIGVAWDKSGDHNKALEFHQKCLEIRLKTLGDQHPDVAATYINIGSSWSNKGDYDKALDFYQQSLDIQLKTTDGQNTEVASTYFLIGSLWNNKSEYDRALEFFQNGLEIELNNLGEQHPDIASTYIGIGGLWLAKGNIDKALEFYQKSLAIQLNTIGNQHPDVSISYYKIGNCQKELQMYHEAIKSFTAGFEIQKKGGYAFQIAQCYEALSENHVALDYYIQSAEIRTNDPEAGLEHESTIKSIENTNRLANLIDKELPKWIKNYIKQK